MTNVSGIEILQRKSRSSRMSEHDAVGPRMYTFHRKGCFDESGVFYRRNLFSRKCRVYSLSFFKLSQKHAGIRAEKTHTI